MSRFLLDTDVVSMLSPSRLDTPPRFLAWLERADIEGGIFLSVVTIHEIEKGIVLLEQKAATPKAAGLRNWLTGLTATFTDKILSLDADAAALSGRLEAQALAQGADPGMADAAIAGIAQAHELTIVSRNARHFRALGTRVLTPEEAIS